MQLNSALVFVAFEYKYMTELQGMILGSATMEATIRTRTGLALHHLLAAGRCAAQVSVLESENNGKPLGPFWDEIFQNSLGVVTLSVAALECYANELWFEQVPVRPDLNETAAVQISELVDRESILKKYSLALALRTGRNLELGCEPVQNADSLIKLRNGVVHFRPEWFDSQIEHERLSKRLNGKFSSSEFLPNEPIFPRAWATGNFASWAIRSTVNFLDYFYTESGYPSPIEKFKPRIEETSGVAL